MILQDVKLYSVIIKYLLQWVCHHFYEKLTWCLTTLPWPSQKTESQQWVLDTGRCYPSVHGIVRVLGCQSHERILIPGAPVVLARRGQGQGAVPFPSREGKNRLSPRPTPHTLHAFCYSCLSSRLPSLAQQDGGSAGGPLLGWRQRKGNGITGALVSPTCVYFHLIPIWQMEK